jgi:transposase
VTSSTLEPPDEIAVLSARLAAAERQLAEKQTELVQRDTRITQLEHEVAQLRRMHFGPRSERRAADDPSQSRFVFPELLDRAQRVADATGAQGTIEVEVAGHKRRRRAGRRQDFPEHLPVVKTTFELPEEARQCCGHTMVAIGHDETKELERVETTLVHVIARTKYACRCCGERVLTAPGPARVIDKGLLGSGFLAHVIAERFARHMPYYRLEQKYADEGLSLSRSVLCRSALRCAELLLPIAEQVKREVLASPLVQTDDTPITIQTTPSGGRRTGHAWVYCDLEGRCVYDFTETRSRDGPLSFLANYRGYVQADAFPGYDVLFVGGLRTEVACWAHARRKYVDAKATEPVLAAAALERIGRLYAVERDAKEAGLDAARTAALRQAASSPVLAELRTWLAAVRSQVLDKSPMATAINYTLAQWDALQRYVQDGRIPIDNNGAERALRPLAVGRKNWLFVGHEEAGRKGAVLFSLVATCRAIGIEPRAYLRDVLERIATCSDVHQLTPHGWKRHLQAQVQARELELLQGLTARPA